jgi:hypothetical protein
MWPATKASGPKAPEGAAQASSTMAEPSASGEREDSLARHANCRGGRLRICGQPTGSDGLRNTNGLANPLASITPTSYGGGWGRDNNLHRRLPAEQLKRRAHGMGARRGRCDSWRGVAGPMDLPSAPRRATAVMFWPLADALPPQHRRVQTQCQGAPF